MRWIVVCLHTWWAHLLPTRADVGGKSECFLLHSWILDVSVSLDSTCKDPVKCQEPISHVWVINGHVLQQTFFKPTREWRYSPADAVTHEREKGYGKKKSVKDDERPFLGESSEIPRKLRRKKNTWCDYLKIKMNGPWGRGWYSLNWLVGRWLSFIFFIYVLLLHSFFTFHFPAKHFNWDCIKYFSLLALETLTHLKVLL